MGKRDPQQMRDGPDAGRCIEDAGGVLLSANGHKKYKMPSGTRIMVPHGRLSPGVKRAIIAAILAGVMIASYLFI